MTLKTIVSSLLLLFALFCLSGCAVGEKRRNDAQVHYMLGLSYLQEPNDTLALREFLAAESFNPYNGDIQMALGQAYQMKKAYAEAERHYQRALEIDEGNPLYQNNLAALYLDLERWDDAIRLFRQASTNLLFANSEVALTGLGFALARKGDQPAAIAAYSQAIERNPRYLLPRLRLGELYLAQNQLELALNELKQALMLAPASAEGHFLLGMTRLKGRQGQLAETAFREAVRLGAESEFGKKAALQLRQLH